MKKELATVFRKRALCLLLVFFTVAAWLLGTLFRMQVLGYDAYQARVLDQITVGSSLRAARGHIYDRQGNLLAEDRTVWRIYLSPVDIQAAKRRTGQPVDEEIARGLSALLPLDYETIYTRAGRAWRMDETLCRTADHATTEAVLRFALEKGYTSLIHAEASLSRYYPYHSLAAQVIGFTGGDGQGLFGLELYYEEQLTGTDGQYVTAKDATGKDLPLGYTSYTPATPGNDLVSTLDLYIQTQLERVLGNAAADGGAQNRVGGIVMDVHTGAILAMATLPSYDLNAPYQLDEASLALLAQYTEGSAEYKEKKNELLYTMWSNKTITETYEPGSTFKIITSAMALQTGVVRPSDPFLCTGAYTVGGVVIHCHKRTGHGSLDFSHGLQQSCNPVFMQVAARMGRDVFYRYVEQFGYLAKTGIDLPGETNSIFHRRENIHEVELATAAFGQRFNVSMIQQITAIAAVANGGMSVTPHVMEKITDAQGNTVLCYEGKEATRIVSEETCRTVSEILEAGVSGGGGAKNAYVYGYRVAAKTGTSEKLNGGRVGSCVAYAPADDPQIAVILMVDEPSCAIKYGSTTAAPYVSDLLENILPYLGNAPSYTEEELQDGRVNVESYIGLSRTEAATRIRAAGLTPVYGDDGTGETITAQVPEGGTTIRRADGKVILYTGGAPRSTVAVPAVLGMGASDANIALTNAGLNVRILGATNYHLAPGAVVVAVSHAAGEYVPPGTAITVTFRYLEADEEDL